MGHGRSSDVGAVISQEGRPLAFFSRKLSSSQEKYGVTDLELLSIVGCLNEFKGMLWGQRIRVYTDHKNLEYATLGSSSDRTYCWRLILEEYGPEIQYIQGKLNIPSDATSRLEYDPHKNVKDISSHIGFCVMAKILAHYVKNDEDINPSEGVQSSYYTNLPPRECIPGTSTVPNEYVSDCLANHFANASKEGKDIYPVTVSEIANTQHEDKELKTYYRQLKNRQPLTHDKYNGRITLKVIDDIDILVYDEKRLVVPTPLQKRVVQWYHHYLMHPGHDRLELTIAATLY